MTDIIMLVALANLITFGVLTATVLFPIALMTSAPKLG
jgi:hypothetical protein